MPAVLDHTIVHASDPAESAQFLSRILGLPAPERVFSFHVVSTGNGVSLDFMQSGGEVHPQHYAFIVGDDEFDEVLSRVEESGCAVFADPGHSTPGINSRFGGRGFYFDDPDGHNLEVMTRPYVPEGSAQR